MRKWFWLVVAPLNVLVAVFGLSCVVDWLRYSYLTNALSSEIAAVTLITGAAAICLLGATVFYPFGEPVLRRMARRFQTIAAILSGLLALIGVGTAGVWTWLMNDLYRGNVPVDWLPVLAHVAIALYAIAAVQVQEKPSPAGSRSVRVREKQAWR